MYYLNGHSTQNGEDGMQNSENKKYKIRSTKLPENSENGRVGEKWRNKMKFCKKRIMAVVL